MDAPDVLEVAAQALSALLATWLALTVATRSSLPVARVFTFLALVLATWSSSIILQRLTTSPDARAVGRSIEDLAAALAIGGLAHFALSVATNGHPSRRQLAIVVLGYVILVAFALPTILHFETQVAISPPHFSFGPIPGAVLGWGWIAARLAAIVLGAGWLMRAMRVQDPASSGGASSRAALATILMAGFGASLRFLPVVGDADRVDRDLVHHARRGVRGLRRLRGRASSSAPRWRRAPSGPRSGRRRCARAGRGPARASRC